MSRSSVGEGTVVTAARAIVIGGWRLARTNCTSSRRTHSKLLDGCITRGDSLLLRQRIGNPAEPESHLGADPCFSCVNGKPAAGCAPDNCREQPFPQAIGESVLPDGAGFTDSPSLGREIANLMSAEDHQRAKQRTGSGETGFEEIATGTPGSRTADFVQVSFEDPLRSLFCFTMTTRSSRVFDGSQQELSTLSK